MAGTRAKPKRRSPSPAVRESKRITSSTDCANAGLTAGSLSGTVSMESVLACCCVVLLWRDPVTEILGSSKNLQVSPWNYQAIDANSADAFFGSVDLSLLVKQWFMYYLIGSIVTACTHFKTFEQNKAERDLSNITVMRLASRGLVSTTMYVVPPVMLWQHRNEWNPWTGGQWCAPLGGLESWLLHMQFMYYVSDIPLSLYCGDLEQIIHHFIGVFLVLPTLVSGACGVPTVAGLWCLQGSTIFTRYVKILRMFPVEKYCPLEKALVRLNYYQCFIFFLPMVATPLLINVAKECFTTDPMPDSPADVICGVACLAQLAYEWYWNLRMKKAWISYGKKVAEAGKDASDSPVFASMACIATGFCIATCHCVGAVPYQGAIFTGEYILNESLTTSGNTFLFDTAVWTTIYTLWCQGTKLSAHATQLNYKAADNFPAWTFPALFFHQAIVLPVSLLPALLVFFNNPVLRNDDVFFGNGDREQLGWAAIHVLVPAGVANFLADNICLPGFFGFETLGVGGMAHHVAASIGLSVAGIYGIRGYGAVLTVFVVMELGSLARNIWAFWPNATTLKWRTIGMNVSNLTSLGWFFAWLRASSSAYYSGEMDDEVARCALCATITVRTCTNPYTANV